MNAKQIKTELAKIHAIHNSLDENNILTFIIFLESYKTRLSAEQIIWVNDKIDMLEEENRQKMEESLQNIDVNLAKAPLTHKYEATGNLQVAGSELEH